MSSHFNSINYTTELSEFYFTASDIEFYATKLMLDYLVSSHLEDLKKQSVTKLLTLFIWIGKSDILSSKNRCLLEETLKDLSYGFSFKELPLILKHLLNTLKNNNSKIHILEHLIDLEDLLHNQNEFPSLEKEALLAKLNVLAKNLNQLTGSIKIMQIERALKELKKFAIQDLKQADQKISLIIHNSAA